MPDKNNHTPRLLNLGYENISHSDWTNINFRNHGEDFLIYAPNQGIPFPDNTFDVVYHSHFMEKLTRDEGKNIIEECFRVLRPGGLMRIITLDFESLAANYIHMLQELRAGKKSTTHYEQEYTRFITQIVKQKENESLAWIYDEITTKKLILDTGFSSALRSAIGQSASSLILDYKLDTSNPRTKSTHNHLVIEAQKPAQENKQTKILQLSAQDHGGAGIAASRLHQILCDNAITSTMYVASKKHKNARIHVIPTTKKTIRLLPDGYSELSEYPNTWQAISSEIKKYKNRPDNLELFSIPQQLFDPASVPFWSDFGIIHLHWISTMLDPSCCKEHLKNIPIIWTLHDMNPFTGGCHHSDDCEKYREHCGACPHLGSNDEKDLSFQTWRSRMSAYRELDLHIVAPSQWLAEKAKSSSLFSRFPIHIIPNAHPLDIFRPLNRTIIRKNMNFHDEEFVICFSAQFLNNIRKGFSYLLGALKLIADNTLINKIHLLLLGKNPPEDFFKLGIKATHLGHISEQSSMAIVYNACDALVLPSIAENMPNVICEALGCGTPVVASAVGGIPEMIQHESTGWLSSPKNAESLASGLIWAQNSKQDPSIRLRCRSFALEKWSVPTVSRMYKQLYSGICEKHNKTAQIVEPT